MKTLLLFRGSPGCGKSTYIEEHNLKPYTLSSDDIRLLCQSPVLQVDGTYGISQNNDKLTWDILFRLLENRMEKGEFTVIDATNSQTSELKRYKQLAEKYRYRIFCIDMTDIPIEEVKRRNAQRTEIKRVPNEVIDKFYERFKAQKVPSEIKMIKPDELDAIWYKPIDLSEYNQIYVAGDIHGCYTALKEYIKSIGGIKQDSFYIFTGDYLDRGIENAETINYLCDLMEYKNVIFLEGNHERHLWNWANDCISQSKDFETFTKPQLIQCGVSKRNVRKFYRKLRQCAYFVYHGKTFIVTHGGISNMPNNLLTLATEQMVKGVGKYDVADMVDQNFVQNTDQNTYQIHGHRNTTNAPIQNTERTFNLEGQIEFGGHLRAIEITKDKITPIEIQNNVFKISNVNTKIPSGLQGEELEVANLVKVMRENVYISEKPFGRISSFNFTRKAFQKGAWDKIVNKARGLYIDTKNYKVVARAYDKFFNIGERDETKLHNLQHKLQFPVTAYVKENGFLGIVSWNPEIDDLLITTKSSMTGEFSVYLENALYSIYGLDTMEKIKEYIKKHNVSFVFECCDMENDPHIIAYWESKVVLLDIVKNQLTYEKLTYDQLVKVANEMNLLVKERTCEIHSWQEFLDWYKKVTDNGYLHIEGFVIEDSTGYMAKLKTRYYCLWKRLRNMANSILKCGKCKNMIGAPTQLEYEWVEWCKDLYQTLPYEDREILREQTSFIYLRNRFLKWKIGV